LREHVHSNEGRFRHPIWTDGLTDPRPRGAVPLRPLVPTYGGRKVRGGHGTKDSCRAVEGLAPVPDDAAHHAAGGVLEVCLGSSLHPRTAEPCGAARAQRPPAAPTRAVLCRTPSGRAPGVVLLTLSSGPEWRMFPNRHPFSRAAVTVRGNRRFKEGAGECFLVR
jgi:hypothetical protein